MPKVNIKLSPAFRKQTQKAIVSIILFTLTYIVVLLMAIGLTVICVYGGFNLITLHPSLITIILGIGLGSLGILIIIFLLKFIFKSHKVDRSHLHEIKRIDAPKLFDLLDDIVKAVDTDFPKKVYLSADINASVFYDSSFWSMFFPIKKNLQIGMGLVNTITAEEFKAILSHEFGHFSQKTMKVGSYVYNVNQVIFNMLYDNDSYDKLMQSWASISGYFSFFVVIALKILELIQWLMQQMYAVVNKRYMALSREMEFHADEIAAHITGYEVLKSSLLRMSLADHAFNSVLAFYQEKFSENIKSKNLYRDHSFAMKFLAEDSNIETINGLPNVTLEALNKFNKSKLVIEDQWASHPTTEQRIQRLEQANLKAQQGHTYPANGIFDNVEDIQKALTTKVFEAVEFNGEVSKMPFNDFKTQYKKNFLNNTFSEIYNGYYDNKNPISFDIDTLKQEVSIMHFIDLFSNKKIDVIKTVLAIQNDMEVLKQIADKTITIKTFDYDGKKYKRKEAKQVLCKLEEELKVLKKLEKENDINIYHFFITLEEKQGEKYYLKEHYKTFFGFDKAVAEKDDICIKLSEALHFINTVTPYDEIKSKLKAVKPLEAKLKVEIKTMLENPMYKKEITGDIRDNFELYLSKDWPYFGNETYFDHQLEMLFFAINNFAYILSRGYFILKKQLLDYQVELIKPTHV